MSIVKFEKEKFFQDYFKLDDIPMYIDTVDKYFNQKPTHININSTPQLDYRFLYIEEKELNNSDEIYDFIKLINEDFMMIQYLVSTDSAALQVFERILRRDFKNLKKYFQVARSNKTYDVPISVEGGLVKIFREFLSKMETLLLFME